MKKDFKAHEVHLQKQLQSRDETIGNLEKATKSLENEKSVLSAAIEARDNKLAKIQSQLEEMKTLKLKVQDGEKAQNKLDQMKTKFENLCSEIDNMTASKEHVSEELEKARKKIEELETTVQDEKKMLANVKLEASKVKLQFQKTRGERNTYKQKADSLVKEMSRICRNGKGIEDIEKIMNEHETLVTEVAQLRSEKKKAINEAQECRNEYEEYVKAQIQQSGEGNSEAVKILKRNKELERIVSEMTEYLNAKQMQLESVQDANRSLSEELRLMAQQCRQNNDV